MTRGTRHPAAIALLATLAACGGGQPPPAPQPDRSLPVTSPAFDDGETIPTRHTCDGADVPPPLEWTGLPDDAAEVAVLVEDLDAPGGVFVHWVAAGIDPSAAALTTDVAPPVEGANDFGTTGYRGPCPPEGDDPHRYVVTVFVADRPLDLPAGASAADLRAALDDTALARGQVTGRYGR